MNKLKSFRKMKRVICPDCNGEKTVFTYCETEHENTNKKCPMCDGEGIMFRITQREYKKLKDANR